jgi:membrane-associated phospholipid phosphatase
VNEYAAMPSLHVAWNLLICLAIATSVRNPVVRFWAAGMPLLMSAAVVLTGNHWILDCVAGYAVGWAGLGLALLAKKEGWRVRHAISEALKVPASA